MDPDRALDEYASRQYGVFSLAQATSAGMTSRMVDVRVGRGSWIRLASGVYALASAPPRWERQLAGAILGEQDAIAAGQAAAHLHGFSGFRRGRPVIMVPEGRNARSPLARVIRSRWFEDVRRSRVGAFLCTDPAETIVTLARDLSSPRIEHLVDECLASGLVDIDVLTAVVADRGGSPGMSRLRPILEERTADAYQPPTSELERLLHRLLDHPSVPAHRRQHPFRSERIEMIVDAYIPEWRLIVEADGRRWHTRKADFERDRLRDNAATARGIAVLRFTWRMLKRDPNGCLATLIDTGVTRTAS